VVNCSQKEIITLTGFLVLVFIVHPSSRTSLEDILDYAEKRVHIRNGRSFQQLLVVAIKVTVTDTTGGLYFTGKGGRQKRGAADS